jgi:TPR repeat protein
MRVGALLIWLLALSGCADPIENAYTRGIDAYAAQKYSEAEPFIRQAAEAGHIDGMSILGAMYLFGRGVPMDERQAEYWLLQAATKGSVDAQSILGIMYATGQGVKKNLTEAFKWLEPAAKGGDKQAKRMLEQIKASGTSI